MTTRAPHLATRGVALAARSIRSTQTLRASATCEQRCGNVFCAPVLTHNRMFARDKIEQTHKRTTFLQVLDTFHAKHPTRPMMSSEVRNRSFPLLFILEMIIFPRQAQDKHWEKAQKRDRFLAVLLVQPIPCAPRWRYSPQQLGGLVRGITG